jgi:eukaryotic-like serine/threonine-protein kinase
VYVGSCNGFFRSLDAKTGKVQWETSVRPAAAKQYFFHGDVFIAPDRIVASTDVDTSTGAEAGIHAFDRSTGRHIWKYPTGRGVLGAVAVLGGRVFAYASTGDLIALNLDSGKPQWTNSLKAAAWESPGANGNRVFAASNDGSMYAFDPETGRSEWQQKLSAPVATSIRATASDVYAGTADGTLYRLAASTGEVRSSVKIDEVLTPVSAPLVRKDAIVVLLADKNATYRALVSLDPMLGAVRWRQTAPDGWTTSRVFATDRTVLVGTRTGEITAYCVADGSQAWSHKLGSAPIRSIGGSDDTLYVGTPAGTLYALRPSGACQ